MKTIEQKIIDAIIKKAELVCPESLDLIGIYGSFATGDIHPKSDLDLLILINDGKGYQIADGFILDDIDVGYDIYCTTWEMLENDAACNHPYLSKLLDSPIVYLKDEAAAARLEALRDKAKTILSSEKRYDKAAAALEIAKKMYADCLLADSFPQAYIYAGEVIYYLLNAVMLCNGGYFKKGVKRTFEELAPLGLPFDMEALVMAVIEAETTEKLSERLTVLLRTVAVYLSVPKQKEQPARENIAGTYEEMFSNWRNKMYEAAEKKDLYSSYSNMVSFVLMMQDIADEVEIGMPDIMSRFDPKDLSGNAQLFDDALDGYLAAYQKAGIKPKRYDNVEKWVAAYLNNGK